MINKVLLIIACIFFFIGAFWNPPRVNLTSLGFALATLSFLI